MLPMLQGNTTNFTNWCCKIRKVILITLNSHSKFSKELLMKIGKRLVGVVLVIFSYAYGDVRSETERQQRLQIVVR